MMEQGILRARTQARRSRAKKRLRTIAYQSAQTIVDKAARVVSEDLTSPIASKVQWKRYNRRMSGWAKGALADALDSVCEKGLELGGSPRQPSTDKSIEQRCSS